MLDIEFLITDPSDRAHHPALRREPQAIGIRPAPPHRSAQYSAGSRASTSTLHAPASSMRHTPGVEIRNFFASEAAKTDGSCNLAGIRPVSTP